MTKWGLSAILVVALGACSMLGVVGLGDDEDEANDPTPNGSLQEQFGYFDQNNDGVISSGEYFNRRRSWFLMNDADGDGVVGQGWRNIRRPMDFSQYAELWMAEFEQAAGSDGVVTFAEFSDFGGM